MNNIGIIDAHVHIFSEAIAQNRTEYFDDEGFRMLYSAEKAKIVTGRELLKEMNLNRIDLSVSLGFPWRDCHDTARENEYILSVAAETKKTVPFASVALNDKNIRNSVRQRKTEGFIGIGEIGFYADGYGKEQESYLDEVLDACEEENLAAVIHVNEPIGHSYTGKYLMSFARIVSIIERHQNCRISLAHWGGGIFVYELMPEIRRLFGNVWYDTAASIFLYEKGIFRTGIDAAGSRKVIFGSDYPLIKPVRYFEQINELGEDDRHDVLSRNICRFLNMEIKTV